MPGILGILGTFEGILGIIEGIFKNFAVIFKTFYYENGNLRS